MLAVAAAAAVATTPFLLVRAQTDKLNAAELPPPIPSWLPPAPGWKIQPWESVAVGGGAPPEPLVYHSNPLQYPFRDPAEGARVAHQLTSATPDSPWLPPHAAFGSPAALVASHMPGAPVTVSASQQQSCISTCLTQVITGLPAKTTTADKEKATAAAQAACLAGCTPGQTGSANPVFPLLEHVLSKSTMTDKDKEMLQSLALAHGGSSAALLTGLKTLASSSSKPEEKQQAQLAVASALAGPGHAWGSGYYNPSLTAAALAAGSSSSSKDKDMTSLLLASGLGGGVSGAGYGSAMPGLAPALVAQLLGAQGSSSKVDPMMVAALVGHQQGNPALTAQLLAAAGNKGSQTEAEKQQMLTALLAHSGPGTLGGVGAANPALIAHLMSGASGSSDQGKDRALMALALSGAGFGAPPGYSDGLPGTMVGSSHDSATCVSQCMTLALAHIEPGTTPKDDLRRRTALASCHAQCGGIQPMVGRYVPGAVGSQDPVTYLPVGGGAGVPTLTSLAHQQCYSHVLQSASKAKPQELMHLIAQCAPLSMVTQTSASSNPYAIAPGFGALEHQNCVNRVMSTLGSATTDAKRTTQALEVSQALENCAALTSPLSHTAAAASVVAAPPDAMSSPSHGVLPASHGYHASQCYLGVATAFKDTETLDDMRHQLLACTMAGGTGWSPQDAAVQQCVTTAVAMAETSAKGKDLKPTILACASHITAGMPGWTGAPSTTALGGGIFGHPVAGLFASAGASGYQACVSSILMASPDTSKATELTDKIHLCSPTASPAGSTASVGGVPTTAWSATDGPYQACVLHVLAAAETSQTKKDLLPSLNLCGAHAGGMGATSVLPMHAQSEQVAPPKIVDGYLMHLGAGGLTHPYGAAAPNPPPNPLFFPSLGTAPKTPAVVAVPVQHGSTDPNVIADLTQPFPGSGWPRLRATSTKLLSRNKDKPALRGGTKKRVFDGPAPVRKAGEQKLSKKGKVVSTTAVSGAPISSFLELGSAHAMDPDPSPEFIGLLPWGSGVLPVLGPGDAGGISGLARYYGYQSNGDGTAPAMEDKEPKDGLPGGNQAAPLPCYPAALMPAERYMNHLSYGYGLKSTFPVNNAWKLTPHPDSGASPLLPHGEPRAAAGKSATDRHMQCFLECDRVERKFSKGDSKKQDNVLRCYNDCFRFALFLYEPLGAGKASFNGAKVYPTSPAAYASQNPWAAFFVQRGDESSDAPVPGADSLFADHSTTNPLSAVERTGMGFMRPSATSSSTSSEKSWESAMRYYFADAPPMAEETGRGEQEIANLAVS